MSRASCWRSRARTRAGRAWRSARAAAASRAADVDRALSEDRSLLITWCNRGTLHLIASEDYGWLHALTTPPLRTANAARLAQEGVTPGGGRARGRRRSSARSPQEGPLARAQQLRERAGRGERADRGQALVHLLLLASLRGLIVRGPMRDGQHAYVLVRDWLGEPAPVDRDRALAELARRYLAGHGPADERDLAKWAGLPLRDVARRARARSPPSSISVRTDCSTSPAARRPRRCRRRACSVPFDPLLLGWRSRERDARRQPGDRHRQRPVPPVRARSRPGASRPGSWPAARSSCSRSRRSRPPSGRRSALTARTSCAF